MSKTVQISGLDELLRKLKDAPDELLERTNEAIEQWAIDVEVVAEKLKPRDLGGITIARVVKPFDAEVVASSGATPYAAYVEFGTGNFAATYVPTLPEYWQEMARTFYVSGKGRTPAQPYMYPAAVAARKKFIDEVKEILNAIGK